MLLSARNARRVVAGVAGAGAVAGAMLFGAIPSALADDPANNPPNCSAADLAGVASGVSASTSAYLFTHPDVNNFFTSLEGLPREEVRTKVHDYLEANPQTKAELTGIRQPLVDLKNRCGEAPAPSIP
ncbi:MULTISPECIES: heme-binding protein [Mycolicibacterium]|jgi:heme-binding protein|uniref:Heme-binding protein n=1 Tax=Mycolicibacterium nivoides TaxID=2487344 RepID=A0ABW9LCI1_9MYCO|nr:MULTISPECIES: heme-binding protein [Mycolicibacterium]QRY47214.1 heme-binding protein [Mycolicibacterium boenickei]SER73441.1 hemophore-related protein, Rv0203/Rv1174c family [Mycobacterium sp. 88mf]SFG51634.1 hemophore-related protein, Rv0203/Rv1174c family [Mycobacterium sp. 455mf]MBN3511800.1 heme-binding protein [Mycolicibacterium septicum]QRY52950.1 heme-binding protein [Mycolicibacterium septicum]